MRFHVLGIPHTATNKDYLACAFTQKVVNLCKMLRACGHTVIHYGNRLSDVDADEHVTVTEPGDIKPPAQFLDFAVDSPVYRKFTSNAIRAIRARVEPNDFLLCTYGHGHKAIADALSDMLVVESGIGYPSGHFAPFKVFESYAVLHAYYGMQAVLTADQFRWYEVVIPNAFDPADFTFAVDKDNYVLFLGMRHGGIGKGLRIAADAAFDAGRKLIVAGPSPLPDDLPGDVEHAGMVGVEQRRALLTRARALLAPSIFLEPFAGVQVEAYLSGTPVISSDWGAFAEYNVHGLTGYRCRTHEQFVWAINHADDIRPRNCRYWGQNFTLDRVAQRYDEYFRSVLEIRTGRGWYEPHPERRALDSLQMVI